MQLGVRQARYVGRAKTLFQLLMAASVANLTLVGLWSHGNLLHRIHAGDRDADRGLSPVACGQCTAGFRWPVGSEPHAVAGLYGDVVLEHKRGGLRRRSVAFS